MGAHGAVATVLGPSVGRRRLRRRCCARVPTAPSRRCREASANWMGRVGLHPAVHRVMQMGRDSVSAREGVCSFSFF
jgi:hypothetical protein